MFKKYAPICQNCNLKRCQNSSHKHSYMRNQDCSPKRCQIKVVRWW